MDALRSEGCKVWRKCVLLRHTATRDVVLRDWGRKWVVGRRKMCGTREWGALMCSCGFSSASKKALGRSEGSRNMFFLQFAAANPMRGAI